MYIYTLAKEQAFRTGTDKTTHILNILLPFLFFFSPILYCLYNLEGTTQKL